MTIPAYTSDPSTPNYSLLSINDSSILIVAKNILRLILTCWYDTMVQIDEDVGENNQGED